MTSAVHVYIHVPFCRAKCRYCAFHSVPRDSAATQRWLAGVTRELAWRIGDAPRGLQSVYVGGGTPSMLDCGELAALCAAVRHAIDGGAADGGDRCEWTVEANPDSMDAPKAAILHAAGVNRVSLGAQSFDASILRWLGRPYPPHAIAAAADTVRRAGIANLGLDLIAGTPRHAEAWDADLRAAAALAPSHLSVYLLSVEAGTPLATDLRQGAFTPLAPDMEVACLDRTETFLATLGYTQYEISNYAQPGCACRHNLNAWRGGDYLGLGPSASSRVGPCRWTNPADLETWLDLVAARGEPPEAESLSPRDDAVERFLFRLRLNEGVGRDVIDAIRHRFPDLADFWHAGLNRLTAQGLAETTLFGWRLTRNGRRRADTVAESLIP